MLCDHTDRSQIYRLCRNCSRLVAKQLVEYLSSSGLLLALQLAYRAHHSTETAVLKVLSDIVKAIDAGNLTVLVLLDLSVAFDTFVM